MTKEQFREIAIKFRQAIIAAKDDGAFESNDRMSLFPRGCCDDTADLFSHYLYREYHIISERIDGTHYDENPENISSHSWQEVNGLVVDLTGSQPQFKYNSTYLNYNVDVYVGPKDKFHKLFEERRREPCKGIEDLGTGCQNRMYHLYTIIKLYIKKLSYNTFPTS